MAPKSKRISSAASPAKKRARHSGADTKIAAVAAALKTADLPSSAKNLLCSLVKDSLGVYKAERHPHQEEVVCMIEAELQKLLGRLQSAVEETSAACANPFEEKAKRATVLADAEKRHAELRAAPGEKQATASADTEALTAAKKALKAAQAERAAGDVALDEAASKKTKLEEAIKADVDALKTEGGGQQHVRALRALGKSFAFDSTLLKSLSTWEARKQQRSDFDNLILSNIEAEINNRVALLDKVLSEGEAGKAERASKVADAEKTVEAATAKCEASSKALSEAKAEEKASKDAVAAAKKAVCNFFADMKVYSDAFDDAKEELKKFETVPLAHFRELKDFAPPPEVPEAELPEATPVAAEPVVAAEIPEMS